MRANRAEKENINVSVELSGESLLYYGVGVG